MNDWTGVREELPKITNDKPFVEVEVRTPYGTGEMSFGFAGAPGESMRGSFWFPIRNFRGEVHLENEVIDWRYTSK